MSVPDGQAVGPRSTTPSWTATVTWSSPSRPSSTTCAASEDRRSPTGSWGPRPPIPLGAPRCSTGSIGAPPPDRRAIPAWWTLPASARDRATGFLPRLMYERLDELGIDFTVLYPSVGLTCMGHVDDDIRTVACRAVEPVPGRRARGPRRSDDRRGGDPGPHSRRSDGRARALGGRAGLQGSHAQQLRGPRARGRAGRPWLDVLALDSVYDYDPVWARCVDLGVAVTVHAPTMGVELRQSSTRLHVQPHRHFAASADAFAKALFFGGVATRFPTLNFAFMECGVSWGVQLLCDLISRWEKRGGAASSCSILAGGPRRSGASCCCATEATPSPTPPCADAMRGQSDNPPLEVDDFRACGVSRPRTSSPSSTGSTSAARPTKPPSPGRSPRRQSLWCRATAVLGSDLGHWDVTDMRAVLPEAYELVENGQLSPDQFQAFACDNAIRLHGGMNATFFDGTPVESHARRVLSGRALT